MTFTPPIGLKAQFANHRLLKASESVYRWNWGANLRYLPLLRRKEQMYHLRIARATNPKIDKDVEGSRRVQKSQKWIHMCHRFSPLLHHRTVPFLFSYFNMLLSAFHLWFALVTSAALPYHGFFVLLSCLYYTCITHSLCFNIFVHDCCLFVKLAYWSFITILFICFLLLSTCIIPLICLYLACCICHMMSVCWVLGYCLYFFVC